MCFQRFEIKTEPNATSLVYNFWRLGLGLTRVIIHFKYYNSVAFQTQIQTFIFEMNRLISLIFTVAIHFIMLTNTSLCREMNSSHT